MKVTFSLIYFLYFLVFLQDIMSHLLLKFLDLRGFMVFIKCNHYFVLFRDATIGDFIFVTEISHPMSSPFVC